MEDSLTRARTATLLGSVLVSLSSGTNYVYSAYAPQLGARLHITYTQLNIIGLSGNMGVYTTGPILGHLVDRRGPRPLLVAAFVLLLVGYTGLRMYYDAGPSEGEEKLSILSLVVMSIFSYMTGAGGNSGLTAASNSTAKSFPDRMRATTVGFVFSGFGLSAFFFSTLSHWLFPGNTSSFLLFLALGTSLPIIIGYFTVRAVPHAERPDTSPGGLTYSDAAAVNSSSHLLEQNAIGAVTVENRLNKTPNESSRSHEPNVDGPYDASQCTASLYPELISAVDVPRPRSPSVELSPTRHGGLGRRGSSSRRTTPITLPEPVDVHGKLMLTGWEFWLLFFILSLLSGTGLMYINNVGSIAQALSAKGNPDYDRIAAGKLQAAQVSIISLANCGARIGIGAGADFVKNRLAAHRSYLFSLISIFFIISQIVVSLTDDVDKLWLASFILGLGYGGIFGLMPTMTIEWFGMAHFSENWGFVSLAPLVGGNVFSLLFGRNLDAHVPPSSSPSITPSNTSFILNGLHLRAPIPEPSHQCLDGRSCYAETLTVTTLACVLALILSLIAAWRDRQRASVLSKYEGIPQDVIWENGE